MYMCIRTWRGEKLDDFSHPSQEGLEGLSDLLPLSVAPLSNDVDDRVFICSCRQQQAGGFVKTLCFYKIIAAHMFESSRGRSYRIPSLLSSALEHPQRGQSRLQGAMLASAGGVEQHN